MIDHLGITVADIEKSKTFYREALSPIGYVIFTDEPDAVGFGVRDGHGKTTDPAGEFWISLGTPMVPLIHIAFNAASHAGVDQFYAAGMGAGGTDNGEPGLREQYHLNYYAAFLYDPDGYNIEAVCHQP